VEFEVITVVTLEGTIYWDVMSYSAVWFTELPEEYAASICEVVG
jgi:hypothetical protein